MCVYRISELFFIYVYDISLLQGLFWGEGTDLDSEGMVKLNNLQF